MTATVNDPVGRLTADELAGLFLFESLDDGQRGWLAERGWVAELPAGADVVREGEPAEVLVVLLSGRIRMSRRVGQDDIEITRSDHRGAYAGASQSYLEESRGRQAYTAGVQTLETSRFFVLRGQDFGQAVRDWFPMAIHLLDGLFVGMRNTQAIVNQRQQLLALGALSAGLTHELNNPAAAAVRATAALRERVAGMRHKLAMLAEGDLDHELLHRLVGLQEEAALAASSSPELSALEESELEDEIGDWLDEQGVTGGWELAPTFVAAGAGIPFLEKVAAETSGPLLDGAVRWLAYTLETELLMGEITDSVTRISSLVSAAKQYSHLDRTPYQRVDLHLGLKSTLTVLAGKLAGLDVVKDFDRSLPQVPVYAAELNQVWTNLIDNAVQAMAGTGTLTLRTFRDGDHAVVEVGDTGPGIPEENLRRIFEPFFTTKPVGQGTGLGLDISYRIVVGRHGGDLSVRSAPGSTVFTVKLPLTERPTTP